MDKFKAFFFSPTPRLTYTAVYSSLQAVSLLVSDQLMHEFSVEPLIKTHLLSSLSSSESLGLTALTATDD